MFHFSEGVVRELPVSRREQRDLIMMRNDHTYAITRLAVRSSKDYDDILTPIQPPELPEPISHPCCGKCTYNITCAAYLRLVCWHLFPYASTNGRDFSNEPETADSCTIKSLSNELLAHLKPQHIKYFMEWTSLLALEKNYTKGLKCVSDIFRVPPEER